MTRGELRYCPECRRPWPRGAEHDLRSFRWLDNLPRYISADNIDCIIHDGGAGRDRFLVLETKRAHEDIPKGQERMLRALAALAPERLGVRVLEGTTDELSLRAVTGSRIETDGTPTTTARVRSAVASWLNGARWREAEASIAVERTQLGTSCDHLNGWAKDAAGFYCVRCNVRWEAA